MKGKNFVLRKLKENDIEKCIQLGRQMVNHHRRIYGDAHIPYEDEQLRIKLKRTDDKLIKIVAEEKDELVGLLILEVKNGSCEVDYLVVAENKRGKGIGEALISYAKEEALRRKCREITLKFAARNVEAFRFYHKNGLNCLGMIEVFMPLTEEGKKRWYEKGKKTRFLGLECYC